MTQQTTTSILVGLALLAAAQGHALAEGAADSFLYPSSVVGTDFDFITEADPSAFKALKATGLASREMPDKTKEGPLKKEAFTFLASFEDGARIDIAIDARFETEERARAEALRYTPRLGRLPAVLRKGVKRVVVHHGGEDATAFSDAGLIVLYAANATKRIATHDLEETVFHESVHAAWDLDHARSKGWLAAQKKDGGFVTKYGRDNPRGEDLAESALFAYTLLRHPERIPAEDARRIRKAIPARIAFVEGLLSGAAACDLDLDEPRVLSDVLSNALMVGLGQEEAAVNAFLGVAVEGSEDGDALLAAAAEEFELDLGALKTAVERFRHCNCSH